MGFESNAPKSHVVLGALVLIVVGQAQGNASGEAFNLVQNDFICKLPTRAVYHEAAPCSIDKLVLQARELQHYGSRLGCVRLGANHRRHLTAELSLTAGAQSSSDQHVSTSPSVAHSTSMASSVLDGVAVSNSVSQARNGGTALSNSQSIASGQGTSISGAFSETEVDGASSLLSQGDAAVEATTNALAQSSEGTTRVESRGVARAKAIASSSIITDITAAVEEVLQGDLGFASIALEASRSIGKAVAGAFAGAETYASVGGSGFGSGLASAQTNSVATASAIAVARAINLISNGKASAYAASQAEGLATAVAEAFSKADAGASTFFGSASAQQAHMVEVIARPVVEVLATALVRITEDMADSEVRAMASSYVTGDAHSSSYSSTTSSGATSTAATMGTATGSVDRTTNPDAEATLNMMGSATSMVGQSEFGVHGEYLGSSADVTARALEGEAVAEAQSNSKVMVEVRNSISNIISRSVESLISGTGSNPSVTALSSATSIADALVEASAGVHISLNVDGQGMAGSRTIAVARATVLTAARTILTAISAAINNKFSVEETITVDSLASALLEASASSQAQASTTGGSAEARQTSVATAIAEVLSTVLATIYTRISDTFEEPQINTFLDSFSVGDTHTNTNAFTSFTPSFDGAHGGAMTTGGAFADFMALNPCTGPASSCCQSIAYSKGWCMCSRNNGIEVCTMELDSTDNFSAVWRETTTGEKCVC